MIGGATQGRRWLSSRRCVLLIVYGVFAWPALRRSAIDSHTTRWDQHRGCLDGEEGCLCLADIC
ncbi:expressed unknown protein [Ectocarpus siliculosus]|uniref:Uncharacterized protein n=1 Tax=Ectocarpus siliculosus TaxID=2880 RepID=D8LT12_ECTSI|nr:expressed unknown protein [Ectocarpus siliculosus]|eukprot:CBN75342.1 expressed unknown protein [Ectocarpus siliculosus]